MRPSSSQSPARRAWLRFRRNRLGYWSLLIFGALVLASLCAELLSNDRPLIVRYQGQNYFPMFRDYPETTFGGDFQTPPHYLHPFIRPPPPPPPPPRPPAPRPRARGRQRGALPADPSRAGPADPPRPGAQPRSA